MKTLFPLKIELSDANELFPVMTALEQGDFCARLPVEWTGMAGACTFNTAIKSTGGRS